MHLLSVFYLSGFGCNYESGLHKIQFQRKIEPEYFETAILCKVVNDMRFEQLECLLTVEETGSFVGAAQKLFVTQQAVSMSMKQLEQELGQPLLIRENKKIVFTAFGEEVLEFAHKMLRERDTFLNKACAKSQQDEVLHINICSNSCVANMTLPEIVYNLEAQKRKATFKISQAENLDSILRHVQSGKKDVGLISMNSEELDRKFVKYEDELQLDILARDELVAVINRKDYDGKQEYVVMKDYLGRYFKTLYNIEPIDEYKFSADATSLTCSTDADFHRAMLEKGGTLVLMSGLSYQYFFKDKKYVSLPLEHTNVPMIHAAIYRKDADAQMREVVHMIRQEMHMK